MGRVLVAVVVDVNMEEYMVGGGSGWRARATADGAVLTMRICPVSSMTTDR